MVFVKSSDEFDEWTEDYLAGQAWLQGLKIRLRKKKKEPPLESNAQQSYFKVYQKKV
ncbi:MAG: hypothetical protein ABFS56_13175 [Pseudomonadota bacterium]